MNPVAIYDIETEDWTRFVMGAIHWPGEGRTEVYHGDAGGRAMAERLVNIEGEIVAHNGGRFDHLWLLDTLGKFGDLRPGDIVTNGQGIVQLRLGESVFVDSLKVFPMSLEKLTAGAKHDMSHACECGEPDCTGYCSLHVNMPKSPLRDEWERYCVADVEELGKALAHFRGVAEDNRITFGRTLGATAWRTAREELGLDPADIPMADWARARRGYHGGRAEVFRTSSARGFACDVNSMYPWALATTELPVDFLGTSNGKKAGRDWARGLPGIYCATVRVPAMFIPPLAVETPEGLAFPYGTITGTWPRPVLEYAEEIGCHVERVHYAVTWARTAKLFAPWIERLYAARLSYSKGSREGAWLKWVMNALTGKLGSRNERRALKIWPDLHTLQVCDCPDFGECHCGAFRPLDVKGRLWESIHKMARVEACAHVEWSAYLTGISGVKLHRQLVSGPDDAVYCDTDSAYTEFSREGLGVELGEWEDKGTYENFESLGPKTYHVMLDGQEITAAKGIPDPDWKKMKRGEPVKYQSIRGIRRARQGERLFEMIASQRIVTANTGRRLPVPGTNLTAPPRMLELEPREDE